MSLIFEDGSFTRPLPPPQAPTPQAQGRRRRPQQAPYDYREQFQPPQKPMSMPAYRPGQAQPKPPQSQGTPYAPQAYGGRTQFAPSTSPQYDDATLMAQYEATAAARPYGPGLKGGGGPAAPQNFGYGQQAAPYAMPQQVQLPGVSYGPSGFAGFNQAGNVANAQQRPAPFTSTMYDGFGNVTTPQQFYPQQQAMLSQIFGRLGQMDVGTYLGPGRPPQSWGRIPEFNYGDMWNQAGQMVSGGWQSPLSGLFG